MKTKKILTRTLIALLALTLVLCAVPMTASAADAPTFSGGTGTESDPYLISSADDLLALLDAVENDTGVLDAVDECGLGMFHGYYFRQTADIDMAGIAWTPMSFCGNYDGAGYAIRNLSVSDGQNSDGEYWAAFFAQLINATVKNLTFENCTASISSSVSSDRDIYVAIAAANAIASKIENVDVVNPTVKQDGFAKNFAYAAGLVAIADITNITDCSVLGGSVTAGTADSGLQMVGGITGCAEDLFYEFISDYGNPYNMEIGAGSDYAIRGCIVTSDLSSAAGKTYAAGIVAMTCTDFLTPGVTTEDCFFGGSITVTGAVGRAYGISGWDESDDKIIDCVVATDAIVAPTKTAAFGDLVTDITNSYYLADAEGTDGSKTETQFAGGEVCTARGSHMGGTATCDSAAVCVICSQEYGDAAHVAGSEYGYDTTSHWLLCELCGDAVASTAAAHDSSDECSICGYKMVTAADLEALKTELETAINGLKTAVDGKADAATLTSEIDRVLAKIDALDDLYATDAAVSDLIALAKQEVTDAADAALEAAKQELADEIAKGDKANADALTEAVKTLNGAIDAAEQAAENADAALKSELVAAIGAAKQDAIDAADAALARAKQELTDEIAKGDKANADALTEAVKTLNDAIDAAEKAAEDADAALKSELVAAIGAAKQDAIDAANAALEAAKQELADEIAKGDKANADALTDAVKTLNGAIDAAKKAAEDADAALKSDLEQQLADAEKTLGDAIALVQKNLDDAKQALLDEIAKGDKANADALASAITELKALIAAAEQAAKDADAALKSDLEQQLADAKSALDAAIAQVQKNLDDAKKELTDLMIAGDKANADALTEAVTELNAAIELAKKIAADADAELKDDLLTAIAVAKKQAVDAANKAIEKAKEELAAEIAKGDKANADALKEAVDTLNKAIDAAESAADEANDALKSDLETAIDAAKKLAQDAVRAAEQAAKDADAALKAELEAAIEAAKQAAIDEAKAAIDAKNGWLVAVTVIAALALIGDIALAVLFFLKKRA